MKVAAITSVKRSERANHSDKTNITVCHIPFYQSSREEHESEENTASMITKHHLSSSICIVPLSELGYASRFCY